MLSSGTRASLRLEWRRAVQARRSADLQPAAGRTAFPVGGEEPPQSCRSEGLLEDLQGGSAGVGKPDSS